MSRYIKPAPERCLDHARELLQNQECSVERSPNGVYIRITGLGYNTAKAERIKKLLKQNGFLLCISEPCPHLDVRVKNKPLVTPETGEPLVLDYHLTSKREKEIEYQQHRERV